MMLRLFSLFALMVWLLSSCLKSNEEQDECPERMEFSASDVNPVEGDDLDLFSNLGQMTYQWSGPENFSATSYDGSGAYRIENIGLRQSGWYYVTASGTSCFPITDSILIDVQYRQGNPSCSLTNNKITGEDVPDLQPSQVTKEFSTTYNAITVTATGSFGSPVYTFVFNSWNGNVEPIDGIYVTKDVPVYNELENPNLVHIECRYNNIFFKSQPNQEVYISHINGKLTISFCNLNFSGDMGSSLYFTSVFSGQVSEN